MKGTENAGQSNLDMIKIFNTELIEWNDLIHNMLIMNTDYTVNVVNALDSD